MALCNRLPRMEVLERVSLYGNVVCLYCAMYFVIPTSTVGVEVSMKGDDRQGLLGIPPCICAVHDVQCMTCL